MCEDSLSLSPCPAFAAPAVAQPIAQVNDQAPIAARGGWVVWSAKVGTAFHLFAWHDGTTTRLKVRGAAAAVLTSTSGPMRWGGDVATFSRCRGFRTIPT